MPTIVAPDTLVTDLLARLVAIQKTIPGVKDASTHFWEPVHQPFPRFHNRIASGQYETVTGGPMISTDVTAVQMLLIGGSSGAGYTYDIEDTLNGLYYVVLNAFRKVPRLNDPVSGAAFSYIQSGKRSHITASGGLRSVTVDNPPVPYLVIEYTLTVTLTVPIPQLTS